MVKKTETKSKSKKNSSETTKDMSLGEIMKKNPDNVMKLLNMGLGCGGCQFATFETLEQGCEMHGLDVEKVLKELNR